MLRKDVFKILFWSLICLFCIGNKNYHFNTKFDMYIENLFMLITKAKIFLIWQEHLSSESKQHSRQKLIKKPKMNVLVENLWSTVWLVKDKVTSSWDRQVNTRTSAPVLNFFF